MDQYVDIMECLTHTQWTTREHQLYEQLCAEGVPHVENPNCNFTLEDSKQLLQRSLDVEQGSSGGGSPSGGTTAGRADRDMAEMFDADLSEDDSPDSPQKPKKKAGKKKKKTWSHDRTASEHPTQRPACCRPDPQRRRGRSQDAPRARGESRRTRSQSVALAAPRPRGRSFDGQRGSVVFDVAPATPRRQRGQSLDLPPADQRPVPQRRRGRSQDAPRARGERAGRAGGGGSTSSRRTRSQSQHARSLGPASNSNGEENRGIYFELIDHETVLQLAGERLAGVTAGHISDIIDDAFVAVGKRTDSNIWIDYRETFEEEKTLPEEGGLSNFFARALGAICKDLKAAELVSTILFIALNKPSKRSQSQTCEENLEARERDKEFIRGLQEATSCQKLSHCSASSVAKRTKKKGGRSGISMSTLVKLMTRIAKGLNVHTNTYPHLVKGNGTFSYHRVELLLAQLTRNSLDGSEGRLFLKTLSGIDGLYARHLCGDNGSLPKDTDEMVHTCASFVCQRWGSPSENDADSKAFRTVYELIENGDIETAKTLVSNYRNPKSSDFIGPNFLGGLQCNIATLFRITKSREEIDRTSQDLVETLSEYFR